MEGSLLSELGKSPSWEQLAAPDGEVWSPAHGPRQGLGPGMGAVNSSSARPPCWAVPKVQGRGRHSPCFPAGSQPMRWGWDGREPPCSWRRREVWEAAKRSPRAPQPPDPPLPAAPRGSQGGAEQTSDRRPSRRAAGLGKVLPHFGEPRIKAVLAVALHPHPDLSCSSCPDRPSALRLALANGASQKRTRADQTSGLWLAPSGLPETPGEGARGRQLEPWEPLSQHHLPLRPAERSPGHLGLWGTQPPSRPKLPAPGAENRYGAGCLSSR